MKRLFTFVLTAIITMSVFAQNETHRWGFGSNLSAIDYSGPITKSYFNFDEYHGVAKFFLGRYLNPSFNSKLNFTVGKVWAPQLTSASYPEAVGQTMPILGHTYDAGLTFEYKFNNGYIFKEDAVVAPYIFSGLGVDWLLGLGDEFKSHKVNSYMPFGLGFNVRMHDRVALNLQSEYKLSLDQHFNRTQHSAGIVYNFGKGMSPDVKEENVTDSDEDGVPDLIDECPFAAGLSDFFGCPDTDKDGLGDSRDECPEVAGSMALKGCPSADRDGDGVSDDQDNCPDIKGEARYAGCPDTDGDGIIDKYDDCPSKTGIASNNGCPKETSAVTTTTTTTNTNTGGITFAGGGTTTNTSIGASTNTGSTTSVSTTNTTASTTVTSGGDLPPFAEPGKCYAKCHIPAQYDYVSERVIDQAQQVRSISLPALYTTVYDTVVTNSGSVRTEQVPAEYEWINEQIMVEPAQTKWVKGKADAGCLSENPDDCTVMCLVEVPAQYKTVRKKVLKHEAYTKTIEVPQQYKIVSRQVQTKPAGTSQQVIPATYKTIQKRVETSPGGHSEWREVLCGDQLTSAKISQIQSALRSRGYDPGPIDNIFGGQTKTALRKFQMDNGLPVGNLDYETLRALGL